MIEIYPEQFALPTIFNTSSMMNGDQIRITLVPHNENGIVNDDIQENVCALHGDTLFYA